MQVYSYLVAFTMLGIAVLMQVNLNALTLLLSYPWSSVIVACKARTPHTCMYTPWTSADQWSWQIIRIGWDDESGKTNYFERLNGPIPTPKISWFISGKKSYRWRNFGLNKKLEYSSGENVPFWWTNYTLGWTSCTFLVGKKLATIFAGGNIWQISGRAENCDPVRCKEFT